MSHEAIVVAPKIAPTAKPVPEYATQRHFYSAQDLSRKYHIITTDTIDQSISDHQSYVALMGPAAHPAASFKGSSLFLHITYPFALYIQAPITRINRC